MPLCPPEYVLNPFSQTCLRIVTEKENWEGAAGVCDEDDEYLAVFDTVESIEWFKNLRHTNQSKQQFNNNNYFLKVNKNCLKTVISKHDIIK